ncbi:MAG: hypothetical protein ACXADY_01425 [Candidatus Hodarchaeales archaeon]|jgi:hypothetical protein
MIELFIGLFALAFAYIIFFVIYSSIKEEKDFSLDVHRYLSRRYSNTVVVDYGGLSSDPIVHSRNAGPFKLIEVKVVTEKNANKTDQDLILRGEVDPLKFRNRDTKVSNLSLDPQFRWLKHTSDIEIGIPRIDDRFIISSDDSLFPRQLLAQTDLGNLLQKSFDLEGYYIRWLLGGPVIQVRMETMNTNSFIQAFNILLGTVGALSEKGYIERNIGKQPITSKKTVKTVQFDTIDAQKEIKSKPKEPIISWEPLPDVSTDITKPIVEKGQAKAVLAESPYQSLFSSISYQAKKIEFEPSSVKIFTFSSGTQEIIVTFPNDDSALFSTFSDRLPSEEFDLNVNFKEIARPTNWSDPWKDIVISGAPEIVEKFQTRTGIAHRITSTGVTIIAVKGQLEKGIEIQITVPKTIRGINAGYSILKDVIWFIEMIFM